MQAPNQSSNVMTVKTAASLLAKKAAARHEKRALLDGLTSSPYFAPIAGAAAGAGIGGLGGYFSSKLRQSGDDDDQDGSSPWRSAVTGAVTGGLAGAGIGGAYSGYKQLNAPTTAESDIEKRIAAAAADPKNKALVDKLKNGKPPMTWSSVAGSVANAAPTSLLAPFPAVGGILGAAAGYAGPKINQRRILLNPTNISSKSTDFFSRAFDLHDNYKHFSKELGDPNAMRAVIDALRHDGKHDLTYVNKLRDAARSADPVTGAVTVNSERAALADRIAQMALKPEGHRRWVASDPTSFVQRFNSILGKDRKVEGLKNLGDQPGTAYTQDDVYKQLYDVAQNGEQSPLFAKLNEKELQLKSQLTATQNKLNQYNTMLSATGLSPDTANAYRKRVAELNQNLRTTNSTLQELSSHRSMLNEAKTYGTNTGVTRDVIDSVGRSALTGKNRAEGLETHHPAGANEMRPGGVSKFRDAGKSVIGLGAGVGLGKLLEYLTGNDAQVPAGSKDTEAIQLLIDRLKQQRQQQ